MDLGGGDEVGAVGGVEAVQVRGVLEVVGVKRAVSQRLIRQDVIVIDNDLQIIALSGQRVLDLLEDLGVRRGGGADLDDFQLAGSGGIVGSSCIRSGFGGGIGRGVGGLALGGAAGQSGNDQKGSQYNGKNLFHDKISFIQIYIQVIRMDGRIRAGHIRPYRQLMRSRRSKIRRMGKTPFSGRACRSCAGYACRRSG